MLTEFMFDSPSQDMITMTYLTLSCIVLKNNQAHFENLAVFTLQNLCSTFGHSQHYT